MTLVTKHLLCLTFGFVLLCFSSTINAQQTKIEWETDLRVASQKAARTGKPMLLHFWRPGCSPCLRLESYVFSDPDFAAQLSAKVIPVKLNAVNNQDLVREYEIRTVPHDVILSPRGDLIYKRNSPRTIKNYLGMLELAGKLQQRFSSNARNVLQAFSGNQKKQNFKNNQSPFIGQAAAQFGRYDSRVANRYAGQTDKMHLPKAEVRQGQHKPENVFGSTSFPEAKLGQQPTIANNSINLPSMPSPKDPSPFPGTKTSQNPFSATASQNPSQANQLASNQKSLKFQNPIYPTTPKQNSERPRPRRQNPTATPNNPFNTRLAGHTQTTANQPIQRSVYQAPNNQQFNKIQLVGRNEKSQGQLQPQIGLEGFCPVALLKEKRWAKGNQEYGCYHRNKLYFFSSQSAAQKFFNDPDRYSPLLAGFDPVAYKNSGQLIDGKREFGVFYTNPKGQVSIVLFQNAANRETFKAARATYLEVADKAVQKADRR